MSPQSSFSTRPSIHDRLGVCSWSLRPRDSLDLAEAMYATGLRKVQLALDPIRTGTRSLEWTRGILADAGLTVVSGMMGTKGEDYATLESIRETGGVRLDADWPDNRKAAQHNAAIAHELGLNLVTLHAGFIPHQRDDPIRKMMIDRLREIAEIFAEHEITIAFETGQETAETLWEALDDLGSFPPIGINFDPANMILYGMGDPVEAVRRLMPRIRQIHIKDANPTTRPGTWGTETIVGRGSVKWPDFLKILLCEHYEGNLIIERESGEHRGEDICMAVDFITQTWNNLHSPATS